MKNSALYLILVLVAVFASCKKDNRSVEDLLTNQAWTFQKMQMNVPGVGWTDSKMQEAYPCTMGTTLTFLPNQTISKNYGPTPCEAGKADIAGIPGSNGAHWELTPNGRTLTIRDGASLLEIHMLSINKDKWVGEAPFYIGEISVKARYIFIR